MTTHDQTQPNILIIHTDEHRADCMGAYGNTEIQTPNLDRLAADSVRYTNSYCPYGSCTPSRYSFLTGLYVHQHRCRTNRSTLGPGTGSFPRALQRAGYRTKAIGKMHFTPTYLDLGFEQMELAEQDGEGRLDDDYHRDLCDHGLLDTLDIIDQRSEFRKRAPDEYWQTFGAQTSNLPEEWHSTTWIADRALRTLEDWTGGGNMLMVGFVKPHHPFDPPVPWDGMYDPAKLSLLPGWMESVPERDRQRHAGYFPNQRLSEQTLRRVLAYYYATISHIDHHTGRLLDLLRRKGLYENTLIIFTADHGEYMGFHHMILKGGYLYDPLVRVPLLVKFPANRRAGEVSDAPVNNIDLAPTILRQAGVEPAPAMKGVDLSEDSAGHPYIFAEDRQGRQYMARSQTQKLLLSRTPEESLFFDLQRDPLETTNLFDDPAYREQIRQHRDALTDWMLFDAVTPNYLDESAPQIDQPNVPQQGDDHRKRMMDYFERKVAAYLAGDIT